MPYKKLLSCFWEKQEQHGSYGEVGTPHSLRRRSWRLKMRFDLKPEAIIHDLRVFRKLYILCVVERTLCRAFTGHRPKGLGYPESDGRCNALKRLLRLLVRRLIQEQGVTHFISGMALGVDMYAAEIVLELKEQYPQITLECAIPYERQAVRWPAALRERYFSIAERCDKETMLQRQYTRDCMKKRNQYMVDCADVVLAVWNGEPSGTGQTVWYAKEKGKIVWRIDPATLVMEF